MAIKIDQNVNLAKYTTFQIGGDADYFCRTKDSQELLEALDWAKENKIDFRVIGGGSNLLISDKGFRGLIILNRVGEYEIKGNHVTADSGVNLSRVARESVENSFTGLDFAIGIPGTIGGAVVGNAGAYGRDMSNIFVEADVWRNGEVKKYSKKDFGFEYRKSIFKNDQNSVVLSVKLNLEKGNKTEMLEMIEEDKAKRTADYSGKNAGSYFTNISSNDLTDEQMEMLNKFIVHDKVNIGKLIDFLGLKGLRIGDAIVSENHANVVLNLDQAKASDVVELEKTIIDKVMKEYGIILKPEVVKVGEF